MKKLSQQLMLTGLLVVSLALLLLPGGMAQAATLTNYAKHAQFMIPGGIVIGNTFDGLSATNCTSIAQPPATGVFYAFAGNDSHINIVDQYVDADGHRLEDLYTYTDTSNSNPSITCWNHKVMVAFNDSHGGPIHVANATDGTFVHCGPCHLVNEYIIPGQATYGTPAIGANGGTLYVAWRGSNNNYMTVEQSINGGFGWYNRTVINGNTTAAEPSLTNYNGSVFLAWEGTDNPAHVNFATYLDGNGTLSNKIKATDTTQANTGAAPIGISTFNGRIQLAFGSSNSDEKIYTGSWSSNTGYIRNGSLAQVIAYGSPGLAGLNVYYADNNANINEVFMQ